MTKLLRVLSLTAAVAFVSPAYAVTNLVINGDFSTPYYGGSWGDSPSGVSGWFNNSDTIEIGASGVYGLAPDNAVGQNLEVNANMSPSTVYQTINGLIVGDLYEIQFAYGGRVGNVGSQTYMTSSFGGTTLTTNSGSEGVWTDNTFFERATATSETLSFYGATPFCQGTCGNEVTNVSVSAVPEAATWAMMALGFASLGFAGYRRSAARSSASF